MRLSRIWLPFAAVALLSSFACTDQSVASDVPEAPALAQAQQAATAPCDPAGLRDRITWSTPQTNSEVCAGAWSYRRLHSCTVTSFDCACPASLGPRCQDRTVTPSPLPTISNIPQGECYWERVCEPGPEAASGGIGVRAPRCRNVRICEPDYAHGDSQCTAVANTHRSNIGGTHFTDGPRAINYSKIGSTWRATCRYTIFQPKIPGPYTCQRYDEACGSTRATSALGLTMGQVKSQLDSERDTDLECTTCDELPLSVPATVGSVTHSPQALAQSKYQCLAEREQLLPADHRDARALVDRVKLWMFEGWYQYLTEAQRDDAQPLYAGYATIPGADYCEPNVELVELPATCEAAIASQLIADLAMCQRLSGEHVHPDTQELEYERCESAVALMTSTPGCYSAAYADAMGAAIIALQLENEELRPRWEPPNTPTSDETVQGTRWRREVVVGAAPPGYTCPELAEPDGWQGGMMFGQRPLSQQPLGEDGSLFCRYEYFGDLDDIAWDDLPEQHTRCTTSVCSTQEVLPGPSWLHPDARVATAQAPGVLGEMQARLAREYLAQIDQPLTSAVVPSAHKVDLAILDSLGDSQPHQSYPLPGGGHGRALAMAAFRAACPAGLGASCPVQLRMYRAYEPGTAASLSDLAAKVVKAVDDARTRGARLILNISLGLHPRFAWWDLPNDGDPSSGVLLPAFAALKAALNYASAHGAISVAAAGNTDGATLTLTEADDLLYPAAFDGESGWTCDALRTCVEASRSLVIAAGGVTADDQPLPNARLTDRPVSFVAPGCNVAVDNDLPWETNEVDLPTYCGSSFGAIGVSTVLAATWAHLPTATPQQLVHVVRSAGVNIADQSVGCTGDGCRVRLCAALAAAGAPVTCAPPPPPPVELTQVQSFVDDHEVVVPWAGAENLQAVEDVRCESDVIFPAGAGRQESACPERTYESVLPDSEILCDQPGDPQCPQCGVALLNTSYGFFIPVFMGAVQPSTTEVISSQSLAFLNRTYELESTLAPYFQYGGSFAVNLAPVAVSPPATSIATFSYLRRPSSSSNPTAQLDPIPLMR
jgi:hypothetical protein